jgi:hypothetical protein
MKNNFEKLGKAKRTLLKTITVLCLLSLPLLSKAQAGFAVGPKVGAAVTSFGGADADNIKSRASWLGGVFWDLQLMPSFTLQPELLITQKGAQQTKNGVRNDIRINYFEIPVLAKFRIPVQNVFFPHFLLGPSFDFNINSKISSVDTQTGTSISVGAGDLRKADIGGILGAGVDIQAKNIFFTVDGRYNFGFNSITKSGNTLNLDLKNRGWTFSVGIGLRFGTE